MGRKIPLVSFLCGVITCHKTTPDSPSYKSVKKDQNNSDLSNRNDAVTQTPSTTIDETLNDTVQPTSTDQPPPPLPPPPGGLHMRASSCHHKSSSSSSSVSKLVLSLSTKVLGTTELQENRTSETNKKDKKLKHEDSIWKKTIILGEKCRVPNEDDDDILYDEKGNRISTYHPKSPSGVFSTFTREASCVNKE